MTNPSDDRVSEIPVFTGSRTVTARLHTPARLADRPVLLLSFASDRVTSLTVEPYSLPAQTFLSEGHRVMSVDLPNHGDRIDAFGEGIAGFRNAIVAGIDPFATFVDDGRAAIDAAITLGIAEPGRIVVCGTSRGGYMALRLLAADTRIRAGAGFAPVTDWRDLSEFNAERERGDVAQLGLSCFAEAFIDKALYLAIGNHDKRVNTSRCVQFFLDVHRAKNSADRDGRDIDFFCTPDEGHTCSNDWYFRGADFLLREFNP